MRAFGNNVQNRREVFLDQLFADRRMHKVATSQSDPNLDLSVNEKNVQSPDVGVKEEAPHPSVQPAPGTYFPERMASLPESGGHITESFYHPTNHSTPVGTDSTGKRPLSYESAARIPERLPPGPPSSFPDVYHHSPLPTHFSTDTAMSSNAAYDPMPLSSSMATWPSSEQPPPYTSMIRANNNNIPQQHTFQTPPVGTGVPAPMDNYTSSMQDVPSTQFVPALSSGNMLNMYSQHYAGVYDGTVEQHYAAAEQRHVTDAQSWLNIVQDNAAHHHHHHQVQPQHDQQSEHHADQGSGNDANSAHGYGLYHDGILDSLC